MIEEKGTKQNVDEERISLGNIASGVVKQIDFVTLLVHCLFQVFELARHCIDNIGLRIHLFVISCEEACVKSDIKRYKTKILHAGQHCHEHERQNQILNELEDLFPPLLSPNTIEESIGNVLGKSMQ